MHRATWITCCWPGLAQLWLRGQWRGLAIAGGFAAFVNLALAATFVWPQWWPAPWCQALWYGLGIAWLILSVRSYGFVASFRDSATMNERGLSQPAKKNDYFMEAQAQYLKQNWFEAEQWLSKTISADAYDIEALLMLITLYRHTGRYDDAQQVLRHVATLEKTDKWNWEFEREKELLDSIKLMSSEEISEPAALDVIGSQGFSRAA